jgi:hypothetical protein
MRSASRSGSPRDDTVSSDDAVSRDDAVGRGDVSREDFPP